MTVTDEEVEAAARALYTYYWGEEPMNPDDARGYQARSRLALEAAARVREEKART